MVDYLSMKVELFVSGRGLKDKDTFSKSDPYCEIYIHNESRKNYTRLDATEVIQNNLNPNWRKTFKLDYFFEKKQPLKFVVFDYDETSPDLLGEAYITLGELVGKGTNFIKLTQGGSLVIRVEEIKESRDSHILQLRGIKLDKKDTFGKSDPYLIFYRSHGSNQWTEVHRTEIIKNTLDPVWQPFELTEQAICNSDKSRPIKVECYDWDRIGSHDMIGIFETNYTELTTISRSFVLINPSSNKKAGVIEVLGSQHIKKLSFIDYLRCGVQISLSIAIDFTGSNGAYTSPTSLHHIREGYPNEYERAIWEVGSILEAYDKDKFFPVFGFGGVPYGEHKVNHCFALNRNETNPYVMGIPGVMELYHSSLAGVALSGPTLFHHVIDQTISVASSTPPHESYYILLILTDGAIMDMPDTIHSVVRGSCAPMSIIIVGVGNAEFDSMEALDCDKGVLADMYGNRARRDIVQFVPFRDYGGNPVALAAEVLKEIPGQLCEFMKSTGYPFVVPDEIPIEKLNIASAPVVEIPVEAVFVASAPVVEVPVENIVEASAPVMPESPEEYKHEYH